MGLGLGESRISTAQKMIAASTFFLSLFPNCPLLVVLMMGCDGERLIMAAFPFLGKILDIPIYCTTQNAARLGATVSELRGNFPPDTKEVDKTAFSMVRFSSRSLSSLTCYSFRS